MIESKLISKKRELEAALRRGIRDPTKRNYALQHLLKVESEIKAMSFTEDEVKTNDIAYGKTGEVRSQAHYVPLPSWTASQPKKSDQVASDRNQAGQDGMKAYRAEMEARLAALESYDKK
jgi:hypothetical protein